MTRLILKWYVFLYVNVWQSDPKRHNEVVRCVLLFEELLWV